MKKYQRGDGAGSAFATVVQGVPTAAIAPASACARAVHSALVGIRNRSVHIKYFGNTAGNICYLQSIKDSCRLFLLSVLILNIKRNPWKNT